MKSFINYKMILGLDGRSDPIIHGDLLEIFW